MGQCVYFYTSATIHYSFVHPTSLAPSAATQISPKYQVMNELPSEGRGDEEAGLAGAPAHIIRTTHNRTSLQLLVAHTQIIETSAFTTPAVTLLLTPGLNI